MQTVVIKEGCVSDENYFLTIYVFIRFLLSKIPVCCARMLCCYFKQELFGVGRGLSRFCPGSLRVRILGGCHIELGELSMVRPDLREGLALAFRLGARPWVVAAVKCFGFLSLTEGQTEHGVALSGLARNQPAWSSDDQGGLDAWLAK